MPISKYFGLRLTLFISGIAIGFSVIVCAFITSFWQFFLFYGLIQSLFRGVIYLIPFHAGCQYFPNHKGLVSGIMMCSYGIATTIFGPLCSLIINPKNIQLLQN